MATLKEIAERTGYSAATISRILSGDQSLSVTQEARRAVLEAAGQLNYNETRSRRGRNPKTVLRIGLADMLSPVQQLDDPYYLYLSNYVKQGCMEKKYALTQLERRNDLFAAPGGEALAGIIAVGLFTPKQIESLAAISPNIVFLDSSPFESRFDSVVLGYELGISLALEHLIQLKHRKIGFVGPTFKYNDRRQNALEVRRQIYCKLMEQHGLREEELFVECTMELEPTVQAWREYLRSGKELPTAVICANEDNAIGTVQCLTQEGYVVPRDISVVSFNDTPRSALFTPSLTSVSINEAEMANAALRLVYERAVLPDREPVRTIPLKVVVPPSLVVRESSAHPTSDA